MDQRSRRLPGFAVRGRGGGRVGDVSCGELGLGRELSHWA